LTPHDFAKGRGGGRDPAINRCRQALDRTARRGHATFAGWCSSAARCCSLRSELRSRDDSPAPQGGRSLDDPQEVGVGILSDQTGCRGRVGRQSTCGLSAFVQYVWSPNVPKKEAAYALAAGPFVRPSLHKLFVWGLCWEPVRDPLQLREQVTVRAAVLLPHRNAASCALNCSMSQTFWHVNGYLHQRSGSTC
jgi:hypothetical protein